MVPQSDNQRVQLEPRGSRRLSSQSLLDLRVSRIISFRGVGRVEVLVDLLNVLNDNAEEGWRRTIGSARISARASPLWIPTARWSARG